METVGSVLWFAMDGCWMLGLAGPAEALALPTLAVHWLAFRYGRRSLEDLAVTGSVNCWVLMNVLWMVADLEDRTALLVPARLAFAAGLVLLVLAGARARATGHVLRRTLAGFRRLRMPTR